MIKRTPLYQKHLALGGKMVDFAGFELPVQYSGVLAEHNAVRQAAGLFDVSHMGELRVDGKNAESVLNKILTNDVSGMKDGAVRYSLIANERGGAVDDVLVYKERQDKFWIVVNGANRQKDAAWVRERTGNEALFLDLSDDVCQLALQGPASYKILSEIMDPETIPEKYYTFNSDAYINGISCYVSRTGYTGEDGFEIYAFNAVAENLYDAIYDAGRKYGLLPCGLGARDTLRLEAGMPLYSHELGEDIPVNETGLNFAIKTGKLSFTGRDAIISREPEYARMGARVADKGIAREGAEIFCGDEKVGVVTSGTHSPTLGYPICMIRIKRAFADKELCADVRGRRLKLEAVPLPFYKRSEK